MIKRVKIFLTDKRCKKLLKNNRGFSLLEVLVAVGIIGIISAIAYPSFKDYRESAANVASSTSASNMAKAFKNCLVLKSFGNCKSLSNINITCPAGATCNSGGTGGQWCAHIKKGSSVEGDDFNICVAVDTNGTVSTVAGGTLLNNKKYCWKKITAGGSCITSQADTINLNKPCTDATATSTCGAASQNDTPGVGCTTENTCKVTANQGDCVVGTGLCR